MIGLGEVVDESLRLLVKINFEIEGDWVRWIRNETTIRLEYRFLKVRLQREHLLDLFNCKCVDIRIVWICQRSLDHGNIVLNARRMLLLPVRELHDVVHIRTPFCDACYHVFLLKQQVACESITGIGVHLSMGNEGSRVHESQKWRLKMEGGQGQSIERGVYMGWIRIDTNLVCGIWWLVGRVEGRFLLGKGYSVNQ